MYFNGFRTSRQERLKTTAHFFWVPTIVGKAADHSQQSCRPLSAELPTIVSTKRSVAENYKKALFPTLILPISTTDKSIISLENLKISRFISLDFSIFGLIISLENLIFSCIICLDFLIYVSL